eukprot:CAMPEP_0178914684 /NCGR_PEP_ID=MMETSP0786-20121207/11572_1 /TAXON_ID=186022 /ORGANISM="Thalassionema frauenfeldii, Strain CCMP 1798" /LENGTH=504 /DNA_ID=CAMNT_0020587639 /DNA_START=87 /DNA_END=1597 /DNA_ORIENTATION=+
MRREPLTRKTFNGDVSKEHQSQSTVDVARLDKLVAQLKEYRQQTIQKVSRRNLAPIQEVDEVSNQSAQTVKRKNCDELSNQSVPKTRRKFYNRRKQQHDASSTSSSLQTLSSLQTWFSSSTSSSVQTISSSRTTTASRNMIHSYLAMALLISFIGLIWNDYFSLLSQDRRLSIDYGGGNCEWTGAGKVDLNSDPYGTLIASYPAGGMRLTWQMTEGAAGYMVGDDFFFNGRIGGLVKTEYPHPEGIWSYGKEMDQTILLIRNPRWNIPSYHTLLYELEYAHDYVVAYENVFNAFTTRGPMENWLKWRDYRFHDEVNVWGYYIDFWMENGPQFWHNLDYERAGQYPFRYNYESERPWPTDSHCLYDITEGCTPKAVVSYERMRDPDLGPEELRRIANVIRYKKGMDLMVSDEAINCIWLETWDHSPENRNDDRDVGGTLAGEYIFTIEQMEELVAKLTFYKHKYSTGDWELNLQARELVKNFHDYINEISGELAAMYASPQPTMA